MKLNRYTLKTGSHVRGNFGLAVLFKTTSICFNTVECRFPMTTKVLFINRAIGHCPVVLSNSAFPRYNQADSLSVLK